jgi:hypothetical protein
VRIVSGKPGGAGRIEIEFYGAEDLNRIYDLLQESHQPLSASATPSM